MDAAARWLLLAVCLGGLVRAAEKPELEVQRYLQACVTATTVKFIELGGMVQVLNGVPCSHDRVNAAEFFYGKSTTPHVKSSRIEITGTDAETLAFRVLVVDEQGKEWSSDAVNRPRVPVRESARPTPEQLAQARAAALEVARHNRARQCQEQFEVLKLGSGELPRSLRGLTCLDFEAVQHRETALRDGARAIYYACLVKIEEMLQGGSIPARLDGATCADLGVNTFGTSSRIHLFPWTPEKYQLTFTNNEGHTRRYPDKTMPTREQAQRQAMMKAALQTLLSSLMWFMLLWLLTLIPSGRFLAWPGVVLGVLGVLCFVPALRYQAIDLWDGLIQIALMVLTGLALSLFLPRLVWWAGRESAVVSFGFSFMLALLFMIPGVMVFSQWVAFSAWQTGLLGMPLASVTITLLLWWKRKRIASNK